MPGLEGAPSAFNRSRRRLVLRGDQACADKLGVRDARQEADRSSVGTTMPASLSAAADGGLAWGRSITMIPLTGRRPTAAMIVVAI